MNFRFLQMSAARAASLLVLVASAAVNRAQAQDEGGSLLLEGPTTTITSAPSYIQSGTLLPSGGTLTTGAATPVSNAGSSSLGVLPLTGTTTATTTGVGVGSSTLGSSGLSGSSLNSVPTSGYALGTSGLFGSSETFPLNLSTSGSTITIYGETYTVAPGSFPSGTTPASTHPAFFANEIALGNGVQFLELPSNQPFGYYSYLSDPSYLYHFDMGYEYLMDAADGMSGIYLYDFKSQGFFYTSPSFSFPYLYDFALNSVVYYYPDPNNAGHYNTDGIRYFYVFNTGQIISK